jgi:Tfp pilus assembly protein PilN
VGIDWKKEVKLSDLFKRSPSAKSVKASSQPVSASAGAEPAAPSPSAADPTHVEPLFELAEESPKPKKGLKKELKLSLRRQPRGEKVPKAKKEAKPSRARKGGSPAAPSVPLMRAFNLLPSEAARQSQGRPATGKLAVAAIGAVGVVAVALAFLVANGTVTDNRAQRDDLSMQLQALQVQLQERQSRQNQGADPALVAELGQRTVALSSALGTRVAWDRVLRDISLVLPDDVWLQQMTASAPPLESAAAPTEASGSTLTINGQTNSQESVARFLSRLETLPELAEVHLVTSAKSEQAQQPIVQFSLTATLKAGTGEPQ